ncbi:protein SHQ1 homolog [Anopheles nili]|uniref:protein SHQ1 homolog n=1 Tax=Anopheles nili TaxID=185578 RepID=UPI00237C11EA|nr:protein SHQ1 homolog [Anopheles nili]
MENKLKFSVFSEPNCIVVELEVPELDLEHESELVLNVFPTECTFITAPYHARIPLQHNAKPGKIFPHKIDYDKSIITFRAALNYAVESEKDCQNSSTFPYGFHQLYSGPLSLDTSEDVKVLNHPDLHSFVDRCKMKENAEDQDFLCEHYGMDYIQYDIDKLGINLESSPVGCKLSDEQSYRIRVIMEEKKRQSSTYTSIEDHSVLLLGLLDILLAVGYDRLTNSNELNEANSYINIHRISGTLSFFVEFENVEQMLRSFYRRSCVYPYYRHKEISKACVETMIKRLSLENNQEWIQQQLMHAYDAFKTTDCDILNHYFIKDYIRYVALGLHNELLMEYIDEIEKVLPKVHQQRLGFNEEVVIQKLLNEIMAQEDSDVTDSDDYDSTEDESDEEVDECENATNANENVLEKLMNLNLSG